MKTLNSGKNNREKKKHTQRTQETLETTVAKKTTTQRTQETLEATVAKKNNAADSGNARNNRG